MLLSSADLIAIFAEASSIALKIVTPRVSCSAEHWAQWIHELAKLINLLPKDAQAVMVGQLADQVGDKITLHVVRHATELSRIA